MWSRAEIGFHSQVTTGSQAVCRQHNRLSLSKALYAGKDAHSTGQGSLPLAKCSGIPEVSGFQRQPSRKYQLRGEALHSFGTCMMHKPLADLQLSRFGLATFNSQGDLPSGTVGQGEASLQGGFLAGMSLNQDYILVSYGPNTAPRTWGRNCHRATSYNFSMESTGVDEQVAFLSYQIPCIKQATNLGIHITQWPW